MSSDSLPISARAKERFAELLARHEQGAFDDWERELSAQTEDARELRRLHARWLRVERLFAGLATDEDALDEAARSANEGGVPIDDATRRALERLTAPRRGAERYVVLERIGQGGMGVVTRARDVDLEREVALKTLRERSGGSASSAGRALRRFLQEARIAARLEHPAILPVHDIGVDGSGRVYFTMPLVRGTTLADVLDRDANHPEAWSLSRKLEALLKVCDALAYAHVGGVVHRDLKPANVLVGKFGETYVTDWGLARVLGREGREFESDLPDEVSAETGGALETAHGAVLGTAPYMAPEQACGALEQIDARTDIYGVGAILYHVLAGRAPYHGVGEMECLARVRRGPPQSLAMIAPGAPEELISICERAMARRPGDRYADCSEFADDLRAYTSGRVVRAHESGAWPELRKWFRRNRTIASVSSATGALALVGLIVALTNETSARREILRLSDAQRLGALEARSESLWPALPERAAAMTQWIADTERLLADLPTHENTLRRLRTAARRGEGAARYVFDNTEDQWRHDALASLVERLQRLAADDPQRSALADVRARLAFAKSVAQRSLVERAAAWDEARAAISRSAHYGGLEIQPQLGLVPLGADPASGLWEFAHLASGDIPRRALDGTLALDDASGIVLVLVPSGRFQMGSMPPPRALKDDVQATVGARPEVDLLARGDETPLVAVELDAFFIAKHELTQAQWARTARSSPSHHVGVDGRWPVETISWNEAREQLARIDLELPTEAQWEYAARAGTTTRYWFGRETSALVGRVNAGWGSDGRSLHAGEFPATQRVDLGEANPWGLLHVLGNVAEWVEDAYSPALSATRRVGDGFAPRVEVNLRAARGGAFDSAPRELRCAARRGFTPQTRGADLGLRAARRLERGHSP